MTKSKKVQNDSPSKQEVKERVSKTYSLLIMGKRKRKIKDALMKEYGIAERTAYQYIGKAEKIREEELEDYRENVVSQQYSHLRDLYERNFQIQDFKECRAVLAQMASLMGANAPDRKEIKAQVVEPPIRWLDESETADD